MGLPDGGEPAAFFRRLVLSDAKLKKHGRWVDISKPARQRWRKRMRCECG